MRPCLAGDPGHGRSGPSCRGEACGTTGSGACGRCDAWRTGRAFRIAAPAAFPGALGAAPTAFPGAFGAAPADFAGASGGSPGTVAGAFGGSATSSASAFGSSTAVRGAAVGSATAAIGSQRRDGWICGHGAYASSISFAASAERDGPRRSRGRD